MQLDTTSLEKAISSLAEAVSVMKGAEASQDALFRTVRAGVIQNFEFSFELSWKFIRRWVALNDSLPDESVASKRELFRIAAQVGLIPAPEPWFLFLEARNRTSHAYDEANAQTVSATAIEFLTHAQGLLQSLVDKG